MDWGSHPARGRVPGESLPERPDQPVGVLVAPRGPSRRARPPGSDERSTTPIASSALDTEARTSSAGSRIDDPDETGTHHGERLDHHHAEWGSRLPPVYARRLVHSPWRRYRSTNPSVAARGSPAPWSELRACDRASRHASRRYGARRPEPRGDLTDRETPAEEIEHLPLPRRETRLHVGSLPRTSRHASKRPIAPLERRGHHPFARNDSSDGVREVRAALPPSSRTRVPPGATHARRSRHRLGPRARTPTGGPSPRSVSTRKPSASGSSRSNTRSSGSVERHASAAAPLSLPCSTTVTPAPGTPLDQVSHRPMCRGDDRSYGVAHGNRLALRRSRA